MSEQISLADLVLCRSSLAQKASVLLELGFVEAVVVRSTDARRNKDLVRDIHVAGFQFLSYRFYCT